MDMSSLPQCLAISRDDPQEFATLHLPFLVNGDICALLNQRMILLAQRLVVSPGNKNKKILIIQRTRKNLNSSNTCRSLCRQFLKYMDVCWEQ